MKEIRRKHYLELHEKSWCPKILRRYMLAALTFGWSYKPTSPKWLPAIFFKAFNRFTYSAADAAVEPLLEGLKVTKQNKILDLCSGTGGPLVVLIDAIEQTHGYPIKITLSDIIPCYTEWKSLQMKHGENKVSFIASCVDARRAEHYKGFRTLSCCLHHFRPQDAIAILQSAVNSQEGILIMEMTERSLRGMLMMIGNCQLTTFLAALLIRPFSFSRFFYTFIIPLVPLLFLFDGITGVLRTYTDEEKWSMIKKVAGWENYVWQLKAKKLWRTAGSFNYILGYPKPET